MSCIFKLDGVGSVDNRTSTNLLHHFGGKKLHLTPDTWHVTHGGGVNILSTFQLPISYGLGLKMFGRFWGKGLLNESINQLMSDEGGGGLAGVIRHFLDLSFRHVTTKTKANFGRFGFFRKTFGQKRDPTPVKSLFENTMGNPFVDFLKYWPKLFKKKFRIEIWTISFQICFQNQFLTLGSGQTENNFHCQSVNCQNHPSIHIMN